MKFIKSLVANVIANKENEFTDDDTKKLESLGEEVLSKIATNEEEAPTEEVKEESVSEEKAEESKDKEVNVTAEQKANILIEKIEDADLKDLLSNAYKQYEDKKETLVDSIVSRSKLTSNEVSVMSINQIERLDASLKEFSYEGRGTTLKNNNAPTFKKPQTLKEMFGQGD